MVSPALAEGYDYPEQDSPVFTTAGEEETVYLDPKSKYVLELESDLDINETNKNDEIFFRLVSEVRASNGMILPEHTRFAGKFKKIKKWRWRDSSCLLSHYHNKICCTSH